MNSYFKFFFCVLFMNASLLSCSDKNEATSKTSEVNSSNQFENPFFFIIITNLSYTDSFECVIIQGLFQWRLTDCLNTLNLSFWTERSEVKNPVWEPFLDSSLRPAPRRCYKHITPTELVLNYKLIASSLSQFVITCFNFLIHIIFCAKVLNCFLGAGGAIAKLVGHGVQHAVV